MKKKKTWNYLTVISGLVLISLITLIIYIAVEYSRMSAAQKKFEQNLLESSYRYHCAFISDSNNRDFWNAIYDSAKSAGEASGIFVENFGKNLQDSYSTDELMKMAVAANVDAILLSATGDSSTAELINEAVEKGIAVSTIYKDDMNSNRFSFTGINNFRMGMEYGTLAASASPENTSSIMILLDSEEQLPERQLLISGIGEAFSQERADMNLDAMILDNSNDFEVEEQVRQFLKENHDTTDIIICTNLTQTQFVSQAAVDLNYVGDFTIIGCYYNTSVLESIKNGVIGGNVVIDTHQMGEKAIASLEEYLQYGYASDYSQVDIYTLDSEAADRLLKEMNTMENGGKDLEN